jgi:hypothetical protein
VYFVLVEIFFCCLTVRINLDDVENKTSRSGCFTDIAKDDPNWSEVAERVWNQYPNYERLYDEKNKQLVGYIRGNLVPRLGGDIVMAIHTYGKSGNLM